MPLKQRRLLIEAPNTLEGFDQFATSSSKVFSGIMFRYGNGLDPLLFVSATRAAHLEFSLFLHLRDMNRNALTAVLRSAKALDIRLIFVGEPLPLKGVSPVGPADATSFLPFARSIVGPDIVFGTPSLFAHDLDRRLFFRMAEAGAHIFAVPPGDVDRARQPGLEIWSRLRPNSRDIAEAPGVPVLVDLSDLGQIPFCEMESHIKGGFPR
ncbi:MAG: hypothetical protein WA705_25065 [Candidatus Ozemobacteraceae bacterium]